MEKNQLSREQKLALYEKLIAAHTPSVLKGDTIPYTSINGHMYSFLSKGDVVALRLPKLEKEQFIVKYATKLVEQYGIVQKEYVVVPDSLLKQTEQLKPYLLVSFNYASSLKPKAVTKKKKAKPK
jgi:hypothetical protein